MTRIFYAGPLASESIIQLDERAFHHLVHVLRMRVGETFILFNGQGGEYEAELLTINKKQAQAKIKAFHARECESNLDIWLAQSLVRSEKMDLIIQKAVELGVTRIVPLLTAYTAMKWQNSQQEKKLAHWQSIIISACEQSQRNHLPKIDLPQTLVSWLPHVQADLRLTLSPHAKTRGITLPQALPQTGRIVLLIGPEGGLSEAEVDLASQYGFLPFVLGSRILRTETAGLAAITAMQCWYGDMGLTLNGK